MNNPPRKDNPLDGELHIGLMSGTSLDGVDGVLVRFDGGPGASPVPTPIPTNPLRLQVLAHAHLPFPGPLADELLALNTPGANELHRAQLAATALARVYSQAVDAVLKQAGTPAGDVRAVSVHGQTVRHQPGAFDGLGYTVQLNHPALLAELCGIDVVADFRSRDLAAGGQGAPLVPAFHRQLFGQPGEDVAVLNIGGISNLTLLAADGSCLGFDCGPGNALMDHWCREHTGAAYDDAGRWAAGGTVLPDLLQALRAEPYFKLAPPKSTGRDLFNPAWLRSALQSGAMKEQGWHAQDIQATLLELTVQCCAADLVRHLPQARKLYVCGGGAFNRALMERLTAVLPQVGITTTASRGLPADQVEAAAFAWLGWMHGHRLPGNLPAVTGAAGPRVLGALYPAAAAPSVPV